MMSVYQGDPLLYASGNGLNIKFIGGQPHLDNGIINSVILSLFHESWFANSVLEDPVQHIGSDFISFIIKNPITVANMNTARELAKKALDWMITENMASEIDVRIRNPNGSVLEVLILVKPPGKTYVVLLATKYGLNWKLQLSKDISL